MALGLIFDTSSSTQDGYMLRSLSTAALPTNAFYFFIHFSATRLRYDIFIVVLVNGN